MSGVYFCNILMTRSYLLPTLCRAYTNGTKSACDNTGLQLFPLQWRLGFANVMTTLYLVWPQWRLGRPVFQEALVTHSA